MRYLYSLILLVTNSFHLRMFDYCDLLISGPSQNTNFSGVDDVTCDKTKQLPESRIYSSDKKKYYYTTHSVVA